MSLSDLLQWPHNERRSGSLVVRQARLTWGEVAPSISKSNSSTARFMATTTGWPPGTHRSDGVGRPGAGCFRMGQSEGVGSQLRLGIFDHFGWAAVNPR